MYKHQNNNTYSILKKSIRAILIFFSCTSTFAAKNPNIQDIFDGKITTINLYDKALKIVEHTEKQNYEKSINEIPKLFIIDNITIDEKDISNIMYDTDPKYRIGVRRSGGKTPKPEDIKNSYTKIKKQINGENWEQLSDKDIQEKVQGWFENLLNTNKTEATMDRDNKGDDTFMNGSIEDSDYDLLVDIQNIGKILFESFKTAPESVFYKYPKKPEGSSNNTPNYTIGNIGGIGSSNTSNAPTTNSTNTTTNTTNTNQSSQNQGSTNTTNTPEEAIISPATTNIIPEIQDFIKQTNNTKDDILCDTCTTSIPDEKPENPEKIQETINGNEYENIINDFLTTNDPNTTNNIIAAGQIPTNTSGENNTNTSLPNTLTANPSDPNSLKQIESCITNCNGLPKADQVLCIMMCQCYVATYPNPPITTPGFTNMNEILRIRFCTVPAKMQSINRKKNIASIDEIAKRINDILYNLIYGGEMTKFKKTKEFLDNPIAEVKFSDYFSFSINTKSKPMYSNIEKRVKETSAKNKAKELKRTLTNTINSPVANPNKYVIISDIAKNKALKENSTTPINLEENIQKYNTQLQESYKPSTSINQTNKITQDANNEVIKNFADYLEKNIDFRTNTYNNLSEIKNISRSLKEAVK